MAPRNDFEHVEALRGRGRDWGWGVLAFLTTPAPLWHVFFALWALVCGGRAARARVRLQTHGESQSPHAAWDISALLEMNAAAGHWSCVCGGLECFLRQPWWWWLNVWVVMQGAELGDYS